ncbi:PTS system galactitol-specific IIA component [Neobacillus niacini]|jgi:galactitol PTS system EIIA component|uniref:PTS sugar transporter subunit IIA n=1 Tax=Neobacillus niacini TaxID=86668 RepID=UPI002783BB8F|nr:PTS sugar transporter subunit IIA [Neobacillus niacini]MDQ1004443.1 PTS system galactitol-specific IIA component [Neobacillus niacini]
MAFEEYFKEELIFFLDTQSKKEAFEQMTSALYEHGFVKETYLQAVSEREELYPTGLSAAEWGLAIPHTDHIHVNKPVIALGILKEPITFFQMGTDDMEVDVNIIFMLAIKNPESQLWVLQMVTEIIQDSETLEKLKKSSSKQQVISIIEQFCNKVTS